MGHLELGPRITDAVPDLRLYKMRSGVINAPDRISPDDDAFKTLRNVFKLVRLPSAVAKTTFRS